MSKQDTFNMLPLTRDIKTVQVMSLIVVLLMGAASGAGLLFPTVIYPTSELRESFLVNDVINLIVGLPILLGALWLTRRGKLAGLLYWPGSLLYVVYNYLIYAIGMSSIWFRLLGLLLVGLSSYTLIYLLGSIDGAALQQRLTGHIPERVAGGILTVFGIAFILRALSILGGAVINGAALPVTEVALNVADVALSVLWIVGGVQFWRRKTVGYEIGPGLLFQGSTLFIGLIVLMLISPALIGTSFSPVDLIVIAVMSMIFLVPFALVARGLAAG